MIFVVDHWMRFF